MKSKMRGFTLIEILTVICIIIILVGLLSPALRRAREQANIQKAKAMISSLEVAVNMYYTDIGSYPPEATWGSLLVNGTGSYGPYMDSKDYDTTTNNFLDPWTKAYNYDIDSPHNIGRFDLWSNGPDDTSGTSDDITNW